MKTSNSKPNSSTSPKNKKHVAKNQAEKRRSEAIKVEGSHDASHSESAAGVGQQYACLSRATILSYAEQSNDADVDVAPEVTATLSEDLSYKLRYVIQDAYIRAQLSGRSALMATDVEATLENLSFDKVLGATNTAYFVSCPEESCYYLEDPIVNLVEIAQETTTLLQPASVNIQKQTYPKIMKTPSDNHVRYFDTMCRTVICNTPKLQREALHDIRSNACIGPIIPWFYRFAYFLLSQNRTYDSLTRNALDLVLALENNIIAVQLVGERELRLLVRLLLQRMQLTATRYEDVLPMCRVLAVLCRRQPLMELACCKLEQFSPKKDGHARALICILNNLGVDVLRRFADRVLERLYALVDREVGVKLELLKTYRLLCEEPGNERYHWSFYKELGSGLVPFWPTRCGCVHEQLEKNYARIKWNLIRSRRKIAVPPKVQQSMYFDAFGVVEVRRGSNGVPVAATYNTSYVTGGGSVWIGRCQPYKTRQCSCMDLSALVL